MTYNLVVENNGPSEASGVVLTDTLPINVTLESVTPSQGDCSHDKGVVVCNLGDIVVDGTADATIGITPRESEEGGAGGTNITNTVTVEAIQEDLDLNNNTAVQVTAVIPHADTEVTGDSPSEVFVGQPLVYTFVVINLDSFVKTPRQAGARQG